MKKRIIITSMIFVTGAILYFTSINPVKAYYYGPPVYATNSPYDGASCDQSGCHNSHSLQSAKPWITSNVPVGGYVPNTIYTITAKAVHIGFTSFGFEISPQTTAGTPLGTLIVTNSATTQIATTSGSGYSTLQYIEQTQYGYQGTDSLVWTFNWKAPSSGAGSVTFYGCFNTGNGNSVPTGTFVYPATLVIPESTAGVDDIAAQNTSFSIFPNPAKEQCSITYSLQKATHVQVNMYAIDGKKISNLADNMVNQGNHTQNMALPLNIKPGVYLLQLITNEQSTIQKIVVE